jgi:DNA-binding CsgD family transcriptional regulator
MTILPDRRELTPAEHRIALLLQDGFSDRQIAIALQVSEHTVKAHVRRILHVLGARNRTHAAVIHVVDLLTAGV